MWIIADDRYLMRPVTVNLDRTSTLTVSQRFTNDAVGIRPSLQAGYAIIAQTDQGLNAVAVFPAEGGDKMAHELMERIYNAILGGVRVLDLRKEATIVDRGPSGTAQGIG